MAPGRRIEQNLRAHAFWPRSAANGPGTRAVLWLQGCTLRCPGCFNPQTHSPSGGQLQPVDTLFARLQALEGQIEGLTISGGEPLQQLVPLLCLLERVRTETDFSVVLFSGYTWGEIEKMPQADALLGCLDVLIAGRYDETRRLASGLRGSDNKTAHLLTPRYTLDDLDQTPPAEVLITEDGQVLLSGIDPLVYP